LAACVDEGALREQICLISQLMHQRGFVDGASGNISARLDADRILTTPSGLAKGFMSPEQLLIVNLDGERVDTPTDANRDLRPTSEIVMHLECYRRRSDVGGVVHAHPPIAVALTIAGIDFQKVIIPEAVMILGPVPTLPYATPASAENREAVGQAVEHHDVLLLAYHGSLTLAKTVWEAYLRLETLEQCAHVISAVEQLGGARGALSESQLRQILAIRRRLGLLRPGDSEAFGLTEET
jgi:L-fuculose-phosphate aldolase